MSSESNLSLPAAQRLLVLDLPHYSSFPRTIRLVGIAQSFVLTVGLAPVFKPEYSRPRLERR
jgi:hypothetical protein